MNFVVDLNLSWKRLVVSAKDFVTLSEILERSPRVDANWFDDKQWYVKTTSGTVMASALDGKIVTEEEFAAMKAAPAPVVEEVT